MAVLLVVVFLIVLIFALLPKFLPNISRKMMELVVERSDEEQDMQRQLTTLKEELAKISIQDEFARYAKTERKINRLTEEIKKYSKQRSEVLLKMKFGTNVFYHVFQVIVIVSIIWTYRQVAVITMPENWLWPIGRIIAFPTECPGAVGVTTWFFVCRSAVNKMLPA